MDQETNWDKWKDIRDKSGANQLTSWLRKQFEESQKMKWFDKVSESESQVLKFYLGESQFSFFPHNTKFPDS